MRLFASNRRLVPSSATLAVLLALPLLSSAIALGMPAAANHEVLLQRRDTITSSATTTPPATPTGVEVNHPYPNRGWVKRGITDNAAAVEKRGGLLELLGLEGGNDGENEGDNNPEDDGQYSSDVEENHARRPWVKAKRQTSISSTPAPTPTATPSIDDVEGNMGFRGFVKRQDGSSSSSSSSASTISGVEGNLGGMYRGYAKRQEGEQEENHVMRGFVKLVKRQENEGDGGVEINLPGPPPRAWRE